MKNIYLTFLFSALLVLSMGSCKDSPNPVDPNDPNNPANPNSPLNPNNPNNPCYPATAEFTMREYGINFGDKFAISDTTINNTRIAFTAVQDCESYEWKVGTDTRTWKTKTFSLNFGDFKEFPQRIPIRLIVRKKLDSTCKHLLGNKTVDTLVKYLTVVSPEKSPLIGEFLGANTDSPQDTFRVTIKYVYEKRIGNGWDEHHRIWGHKRRFVFFNLHKGCQAVVPEGDTIYVGGRDYPSLDATSEVSYRGMRFLITETNKGECYGSPLGGTGIVSNSNETLTVEYSTPKVYSKEYRSRTEGITRTFVGRRVR